MVRPADEPKRADLRPRVLSALVLIAVALAAVSAGGTAFNVFVLVVGLVMAYEWHHLCHGPEARVTGLITVLAVAATLAVAGLVAASYALAVGLGSMSVVALVALVGRGRPVWSAAGVAYIAVPCVAAVWLRSDPTYGLATMLWLLAVVWATDIGAFFIGRRIGGPRLAPRISPTKTWSGFIGGVFCAAAVGAVAAIVSGRAAPWTLAVLSAGLAVLAQMGDLVESMVKRRFGAKDSGQLIPGHGGLLDRLDGMLAATPAAAGLVLVDAEGGLVWS